MIGSGKFFFQIDKQENFTLIKLIGSFDNEGSKVFQDNFSNFLNNPAVDIIVDFSQLIDLAKPGVRALVALQTSLKNEKKQMRLVELSNNLIKLLRNEGVDSIFKTCPSLKLALSELKINPTLSFDINFLNPFLSATVKALETQASTKAKPGKVFKKNADDKLFGDISGVVGMNSSKFKGTIVVSFPETTYCKIISRMLGEDHQKITKDVEDGIGELTNLIFTQARVKLNDQGYGIQMAIPTILTGEKVQNEKIPGGSRVVIPFSTDAGDFFIEISFAA